MISPPRLVTALGLVLLASATATAENAAPLDRTAALEFFEKKVRPVLVSNCYTCHSADTKPSGGLRVDDRTGLLQGGNTGAAIVPGHPEKSLLLQRVNLKDAKKRMPLEGNKLSEEEVADLTTWIKDGAIWPTPLVPSTLGKPKPRYEQLKREHWAWQPLTEPKVPTVQDTGWARDDIDRFLLARLEAKGLKPVGDADKLALLRRVTFDLTGLPPTPGTSDVPGRSSGGYCACWSSGAGTGR